MVEIEVPCLNGDFNSARRERYFLNKEYFSWIFDSDDIMPLSALIFAALYEISFEAYTEEFRGAR